MPTQTVRLHRVLRTTPDKLYRAFIQPRAFERWLPPFGFVGEVHSMEPVVGGAWRMSFTNFGSGHSHSFGGKYLELVPNAKLRYSDAFDDPNLPGTMMTTIELRAVMCGTEVNIEQSGIPQMIPVEMCYLGWQESLQLLAQLVEPEIKQ